VDLILTILVREGLGISEGEIATVREVKKLTWIASLESLLALAMPL
jgi:hypothetical protein